MDDDALVTDNDLVHSPDGLYRFWFTTESIDYWPVTNTSFWLEWRLSGTNPTGYHVTNLLLHIATSLLLWQVLRHLHIPGALLAAILFAVHPVNVESVVWVAQRKNLLAMLFLLLSLLCYLKCDEWRGTPGNSRESSLWYWLSLLAFLLAMLSKGSAAVLPLILVGIMLAKQKGPTIATVGRLLPFFFVAALLTVVNIWFQSHGAESAARDISFAGRVAGAGAAIWFYLSKALLPVDLVFVYPQWEIRTRLPQWWIPTIAVSLALALFWRRRSASWARFLLLGVGFFCVSLLPVLGMVDVGFMKFSLVADHYQHIALIGILSLVAASWNWAAQSAGRCGRQVLTIAATIYIAVFGVLTFWQSRFYATAIDLYQETLEKNPGSWMVRNNLAVALIRAGRNREGLEQAERVLQLKPDYAEAHNNLGMARYLNREFDDAAVEFQKAIGLKPDFAAALNNLARVLIEVNQSERAIPNSEKAVQLQPLNWRFHFDLANALFQTGKFEAAIEHFQEAVRLNPHFARGRNNFGVALLDSDHAREAVEQFELAITLLPDYAEAWANVAKARAQLSEDRLAIAAALKAIELARATRQFELAGRIESWLAAYRESHPAKENSRN